MPQHKGGKKGKRPDSRPARTRYTGEQRWIKNKARKQAKRIKKLMRAAAKRGTVWVSVKKKEVA